MANDRDALDMSMATVFVVGGAVNLLVGALFLAYSLLLSTLYFVAGPVCLWVAWGIWRSEAQVWSVGIVLSLLNLLPPDLIPPGWPLPHLTPWVILLVGYAYAQIISGAIGVAAATYFVTRSRRFRIRVSAVAGS